MRSFCGKNGQQKVSYGGNSVPDALLARRAPLDSAET
jgi:hypothetical protein